MNMPRNFRVPSAPGDIFSSRFDDGYLSEALSTLSPPLSPASPGHTSLPETTPLPTITRLSALTPPPRLSPTPQIPHGIPRPVSPSSTLSAPTPAPPPSLLQQDSEIKGQKRKGKMRFRNGIRRLGDSVSKISYSKSLGIPRLPLACNDGARPLPGENVGGNQTQENAHNAQLDKDTIHKKNGAEYTPSAQGKQTSFTSSQHWEQPRVVRGQLVSRDK
ncbi:hypothetical protein QBC35DRAFT_204458 [Podospora australis]|uniref:Uncharacterized protein n=1 Tax=Podospora australis TaxID=1536484 RepID=A0AAN6X401_9PEZI|nr:hypothetical protein QBC35DRAFT_204458 [Podospora australis]